MPYTIALDPGTAIIRIDFVGVIEPRDLLQLAGESRNFERGPVVPPRMTDLTRVDKINITFENIFQFAATRKTLTFKNTFKSALVVNSDTQMGYARMFQTLNDHRQITVQIFKDTLAAQAWILEN